VSWRTVRTTGLDGARCARPSPAGRSVVVRPPSTACSSFRGDRDGRLKNSWERGNFHSRRARCCGRHNHHVRRTLAPPLRDHRREVMRHAVSLALALTLGCAPVANIACALWCDARFGLGTNASGACHSNSAQDFIEVLTTSDACQAFTSTPSLREDARRVPDAMSAAQTVATALQVVADVRGEWGVPIRPLPANHARMQVLRI